MSRTALADTNILIDMALPDRPEHDAALMLLDEVAYHELELYIAAPSLKDAYYILTKCGSEADARQYVVQAMNVFHVLPVDESVCRAAAASNEPDFEDGIVRVCAEQAGVDCILSRDKAAFAKSPVRSMDVRAFLELFCDVETVGLPQQTG